MPHDDTQSSYKQRVLATKATGDLTPEEEVALIRELLKDEYENHDGVMVATARRASKEFPKEFAGAKRLLTVFDRVYLLRNGFAGVWNGNRLVELPNADAIGGDAMNYARLVELKEVANASGLRNRYAESTHQAHCVYINVTSGMDYETALYELARKIGGLRTIHPGTILLDFNGVGAIREIEIKEGSAVFDHAPGEIPDALGSQRTPDAFSITSNSGLSRNLTPSQEKLVAAVKWAHQKTMAAAEASEEQQSPVLAKAASTGATSLMEDAAIVDVIDEMCGTFEGPGPTEGAEPAKSDEAGRSLGRGRQPI